MRQTRPQENIVSKDDTQFTLQVSLNLLLIKDTFGQYELKVRKRKQRLNLE